jgi:hypothetical protein
VLAGLTLPAAAEDEKKPEAKPERPAITRKTVDALPDGAAKFSGVLVGRVVTKDVEKGTLCAERRCCPADVLQQERQS